MTNNILDKKETECACGGLAREFFTNFHGFEVRGWKCNKCGEELLDPREVEPILKLNQLIRKHKLKSKIAKVGNSLTIRLPKLLADIYNLRKGESIEYIPEKTGFLIKANN